ncbi:MAG: T9SS type A sorting domain-containing protein [Ignavibacteriaceae bacterium]
MDWFQLIRQYVTAVRDRGGLPDGFALSQNYPNPFNPTTNINFDIGKPSNVKLIIYNILGERITTLVNEFLNTGNYTVRFDGRSLASGVYFYSLETGDYKFYKKMMLLK